MKTERAMFKQNEILLQYLNQLTGVEKFHEFQDALRATHQSHLVTYVSILEGNLIIEVAILVTI